MPDPLDSSSVTQWLLPLANGDQVAAQRIFDRYYQKLTQLAQRRLVKLPPQVGDHEGAVNSALRSFFYALRNGQFSDLDDREALYKLLATITLRKVSKQYRKHHAKKTGEGNNRISDIDLSFLEERSIGPEDLAIFELECQRVVDKLEDETTKQTVLLMMEGLSNRDIADKLGIHIRSIQRKANLILSLLAQEAD